tara:strand:- start:11 stop:238 length:228 start_codon:yes stop_codon:yes gene_type:complete
MITFQYQKQSKEFLLTISYTPMNKLLKLFIYEIAVGLLLYTFVIHFAAALYHMVKEGKLRRIEKTGYETVENTNN